MSAIAGLYRRDARPGDRHEVDRMVSALAHRGADGTAVWSDASAALGQVALWTTPEAGGERLPLSNVDGNVFITADARLDNRRELIAALSNMGRPEIEIGDGELILRAYECWGEDCTSRLLGDFSFAIWDARKQLLFCARDHMGVKPFYYCEAGGTLFFASEIKALLTSPLVPYRLNPLRVADHLAGLVDDRAITFYHDIYRLPAGHTLTASRADRHVRQYWALDPTRVIFLASDDAYAAAFRECFAEAVRCRLRSSHPVGCLLSGGLDTSSIVATACQIRRERGEESLDTFTAIFPELPAADLKRIDERNFVDSVVRHGGINPHYLRGDRVSPLNGVDSVLWHLDEAFTAPNLYLHWALYGEARDRNVRPLLDGIDGDTTVSHGLERLAALTRTGKLAMLAHELRALSRRYGIGMRTLFWQFGVQPLIPAGVHQARRLLHRREPPSWIAATTINRQFARRMGLAERVEAVERKRRGTVRSARGAHWLGLNSGLIPYALEMADKAAAAFGLEPRYPFFDRRLVEFCLGLPANQKLRGGWTRVVMRHAMKGILPEDVRWRPDKADLSPNFMRQIREHDRDLIEEVVLKNPDVIEAYVDIDALRRVYDRYLARQMSEGDALALYRAVVLGLWLQRAKIAS
jgi:asparagine synthase (glutamine-hydrolysing)